jgi:UDP-N-acetylmuramate: L-alanyl-gamma-D-glutamyl-meso-diaminopimelate ligase
MTNHKLSLNHVPVLPRSVYVLGICGRMVGGLALILRERGVQVSGADEMQFPPMPEVLRRAGITVHNSWAAAHLPQQLDAVVIGALVCTGNPAYEEALARKVPIWNATAFLEHYFLRAATSNFVVVGTKGKTTTTAMLAWILAQAGHSPDYLIGGQVRADMGRLRLTGAPLTVLEGDEFWCGPGDPIAKFLRYHPRQLVVTNVSYDHREIYPAPELYSAAFQQVVELVPDHGGIVMNADDPGAMALATHTNKPVQRVGFALTADWRITHCRASARGMTFQLGGVPFRIKLSGRMHVHNAALAAVAAVQAGVPLTVASTALALFPGIEGRQELLAQAGKLRIYYDDVYLPMAVKMSLEAIRKRHPRQRLVCFFIPRYTGGRTGAAQRDLPECLSLADVAVISSVLEYPIPAQPFSHHQLCRDLRARGVEAYPSKNITKLAGLAAKICRPDDVVLLALCLGADGFAQDIKRAILG